MSLDEYTMADGTYVRFTKRTDDPEHEGFEIEMTVPPKARATPKHTHPKQTDEFTVVSGRLEVLFEGRWRELGPGDELVVPPGSVHTYRNRFDEPVVFRNVHNPSGSFQEYLERMGMLAQQGKLNGIGLVINMAVLFSEHTDAMRLHSPLHRVLFGTIATVAKTFGVRVPRPGA